jgi:hypothetical protein
VALDTVILGAEISGYPDPCTECVYQPSESSLPQKRGGAFSSAASGQGSVLTSDRWPFEPDIPSSAPRGIEGLRCARAP